LRVSPDIYARYGGDEGLPSGTRICRQLDTRPDGLHPTPTGSKYLLDRIAPIILRDLGLE
jgi:hypothetical protein